MDKNKHLISKYLEGELDSLTSARFEEDLKTNPVLQFELDLYMEVEGALADTEILNLRSQLKDLHEELVPVLEKASAGKKNRQILRLTAAATLLALVTFGSFSLFRHGTGDQRIVNKFYSPYEMTMVNRSDNTGINMKMHEALELYDAKEFKKAVMLFEEILENDPSQMATRLYSGISYLEIKEFQKAGNYFNQIIEHNDNLYIEQAEWNLGFCLILTDKKEKAIRQFEKIVKEKGYYSEKARQILKTLK